MTIEMKATEQDFPVTLFVMLYTVLLTFDPVEEPLMITTIQLNQGVLQCINSCSDRDEVNPWRARNTTLTF